jgi:hypothetical protein
MTTYDFGEQLHIGEAGEQEMRAWFKSRGYWTWAASTTEQRKGIDFWVELGGEEVSVEVKTDMQAGKTGNAFIEERVGDKLGWVYTCQANLLLYWVPLDEDIYLLEPKEVQRWLVVWNEQYPSRTVQNPTYTASGVLVPLGALHKIAREVVHHREGDGGE